MDIFYHHLKINKGIDIRGFDASFHRHSILLRIKEGRFDGGFACFTGWKGLHFSFLRQDVMCNSIWDMEHIDISFHKGDTESKITYIGKN